MEVRSVVQKEAPMGVPKADRSVVPKADRSVVLRVDRMEAHSVVPMEGPRVDWKVDRTEVLREDRRVVRMEAQKADRSGVRKVDRSGVRKVVPRVDRTGERLEGSGQMVEPAGVLQRFPLRVQVGPRAVLPEPRARALPKSQARGLPAWKEAVRAGGQRQGLPRVQEEWPRLAPVLGKEEDRSRR